MATVTFMLQPAILAYYDVDMNLVMTPGDVAAHGGTILGELPLKEEFHVVGEPLLLSSPDVHIHEIHHCRTCDSRRLTRAQRHSDL